VSTTVSSLLVPATLLVLLACEVALALARRLYPQRMARSVHAALRDAWLHAVSQQPGSEVLAVQTLRNSLMSATMTASAAALGLVSTATLTLPGLHDAIVSGGLPTPSWPHMLVLVLTGLLFAALVSSATAMRYYHHVGYIGAMPVESDERRRWTPTGAAYLRRAGALYGAGLRQLMMVGPVVAALLHPVAGLIAALAWAMVSYRNERVPGAPPDAEATLRRQP
jgi:Protein of unknown function, DUF599